MQLLRPISPIAQVNEIIGPELKSMGAKLVDKGLRSVEARLANPADVEVANAAFNDAINGVSIAWRDAAGNGVRGVAGIDAVINTVSKMPTVQSMTGAETYPSQVTVISKPNQSNGLSWLLREKTTTGDAHIAVVDPISI